MIVFLRRFAQYRALEARIADSASRVISAEDRERLWRARAEIAEADKEKAREAETHSLKLVADWQAYVNGMPPIFGLARVPRESSPTLEVEQEPRRRHARDVAQQLDREFREEYGQMVDREYERWNTKDSANSKP